MNPHELTLLKAEIQREENLYLSELNAMQRFDVLRAFRLKINMLKKRLLDYELGKPPENLSLM